MLKTIATFTSPWEAHIAKGRLEAEGIPAFIAHEHHIWANWIYSQALGGVKVQVPEVHALEAARVMREHLSGAFESDLSVEAVVESIDTCPNCGSQRVRSRYAWHLILLLVLTLGLFLIIWPPRREIHRCLECGHHWRY